MMMFHTNSDPLLGWLSLTSPGTAMETPFHLSPQSATLIKAGGWSNYINRVVVPQLNWGCRRFILWLPFGTVIDPYRADMPALAREWGVNWLIDGFKADWRNFIDANGVEVIHYSGGVLNTPRVKGFTSRIHESLSYPIDAGMSVAFDADAVAPDGSFAAHFAQWLQLSGTRVYLEARPKSNTFAKSFPIISIDKWWLDSDPDTHSDKAAEGYISASQIAGEIIRFPEFPDYPGATWKNMSWQINPARAAIKAGYSAAVEVQAMIETGVTRKQIYA